MKYLITKLRIGMKTIYKVLTWLGEGAGYALRH